MILAPRHPERFEKVASLISAEGFALRRRTQWRPQQQIRSGIFLLDSVGELAAVYELADIAFVGGSLVPTGGHNILEPAQYGAAILVGPHTFNFREITSLFEQGSAGQGGAVKIVTAETLGSEFLRLLRHPEERQRMGRAAKDLFVRHAGATRRTLTALAPLLSQQERPR
jgi:3-deoxy-D-manno-octulosonic-acid transferase